MRIQIEYNSMATKYILNVMISPTLAFEVRVLKAMTKKITRNSVQGCSKQDTAQDNASKGPIRIGNQANTNVMSKTYTYQRTAERVEVEQQQIR